MKARSRLLLPALLLLTCLPAWWVASRGIGLVLATRKPGIALRWDPGNAEALVQVNESERDAGLKSARARAVLAQRPRDGRAYRQLAEVALSSGDITTARRLYGLAATYSPRDRWTQAWLADDALRSRLPALALAHIDQLLRMDAWVPRHLFPVVAKLAQSQGFRAELGRTLETASWRDDFLAWWLASPQPFEPVRAVCDALRDAGVPVSASVRAARVSRELREGRAIDAWVDWADGLTPARAAGLGLVVNGAFEQPARGAFDWQLGHQSAADVQRTSRADASGQALRIAFDGERTDFHDVAQRLLLAPGSYRFSAQMRAEELQADQDLTWSVRCGSAAGELLGHGAPLAGTSPWARQGFDFEVPEHCALQWLALELPAPDPVEERIGGTLWIDNVDIEATRLNDAENLEPLPANEKSDAAFLLPPPLPMAMVWSMQGTAVLERGNQRMSIGSHGLVRLHDRIVPSVGASLHLRWLRGCETDVTAPLRIEASACTGTGTGEALFSPHDNHASPTNPIQTALRASWAAAPSIDDPVGP